MHTGKLTKVIATIGPSSEDEKNISDLIKAGVNIFRFNTKHNTNEWHKSHIHSVQKVARELGVPVGILVDLQGPEIRIETFEGNSFQAQKDDLLVFSKSFTLHDDLSTYPQYKVIRLDQKEVFDALEVGDTFSVDDGFIDFEVTEIHPKKGYLISKVLESAQIKNRKGLNLVGKDVDVPSLTHADMERLGMAADARADYIALSFVRSAADIKNLRSKMDKEGSKAKIVAKIESQKGVDNLDEILEVADAVMVARGDLGIEVPIERVTHLQKEMIRKCRAANKPVIVATQMLQSMIDSPRPTRAEAADVANAIFDETDAIMLSGETASGKYPVKAVEVMRKIARYNEAHKEPTRFLPPVTSQTHSVINAALSLIKDSHVEKVIVFTETGYTARVLSSFRPNVPIIAITENHEICTSLTMSFGVTAFKSRVNWDEYGYPAEAISTLKAAGVVVEGETVLIVHGRHFKVSGGTNSLGLFTV